MYLKRSLYVAAAIACLFSTSISAFVCACCAEPGTYEITRAKPDAYHLGLLGEMKFDGPAELYTDAAGFDSIKGLAEIEKDSENKEVTFNIVEKFLNRSWRLNIKTNTGRTGTLTLPLPSMMVRYKVDIHDTPADRETVLYKEFFFTGATGAGSGLFRSAGVKPSTYTLVFQGRGNQCDNSSDFTHWRLELNGARAGYSFYGKMTS